MSTYANLSIWDYSTENRNWYDHVSGRKTPRDSIVTPNTNLGNVGAVEPVWATDDGTQGFAYQGTWFDELKARDRKKNNVRRSKHNKRSKDAASPVQVSSCIKTFEPEPYFEYMFADADLDNGSSSWAQNSVGALRIGKQTDVDAMSIDLTEDDSSPPQWEPCTPETNLGDPTFPEGMRLSQDVLGQNTAASITQAQFDTLPASAYFGSEDELDTIKETKVPEDVQTNIDFFSFGISSRPRDPFEVAGIEGINCPIKTPFVPNARHILEPKSRRPHVGKKQNKTANEGIVGHGSGHFVDTRYVEQFQGVRKRSASKLCDEGDPVDVEIERLCSKKARCSLASVQLTDVRAERIDSPATKSTFSISDSSRTISGDFFNHRPLAVAPTGYAGQFDGMVIRPDFIADFKFSNPYQGGISPGIETDIGDASHPNGIFTHKALITDPFFASPDFTKENLPTDHPLVTCMHFAADMTFAAAEDNIVKLRSHDEEILRRESHIECAHARLEGVSVGYYRFYQGHLSIEEYHDAEMCIC